MIGRHEIHLKHDRGTASVAPQVPTQSAPNLGAPPTPRPWSPGVVVAAGVTLRYWETGAGEPLVVLHRGGGVDLGPAFTSLGIGRHVLCLELPGFPPGTRVDAAQPTFRELAAVVAAAIERLTREPIGLLGVSFGGAVAAWLAADWPGRVQRLILVAPAAPGVPGEPALRALAGEDLAAALRAHPERGGPDRPGPASAAHGGSAGTFEFLRGVIERSDDGELRHALEGLDVPTMVVFGTRDGLVSADVARQYKRLIPRCDLVFVYDAAHEVPRDRPEAFAEIVGDFLARGDAHVVNRTSRVINP
jgi:pimeloyl-ACP methyl ester carboxylesterase